ncbi:B9 domain-containing protein 1 [Folsomia candida]|uniref:B9 domain-containing protein 1 n=1 Tax=Folsomia candida TaxID=158441 RepID=A0A226EMX8_FOLCA|nr:B9 domain-containing protein 1 [Folsomia candida]OXA58992.1 B9 domain-containing protein 1 [Folsomia candida]
MSGRDGSSSEGSWKHLTDAKPTKQPDPPAPRAFLLQVTGRIESAEIFGANDIYCKYNLAMGGDWAVTSGMEEAISQITSKNGDNVFVWNFPLEVTFKSTNPHGWPQLILSVYGADIMGNHIARGYGTTHFPVSKGVFTKIIPLFVPESSSFVQKISSWLMGRHPEFVDPKVLAQNDGRQVVRVESCGHVVVKMEMVTKDMAQLGYVTSDKVYNHDF